MIFIYLRLFIPIPSDLSLSFSFVIKDLFIVSLASSSSYCHFGYFLVEKFVNIIFKRAYVSKYKSGKCDIDD